MKKKTILIDVDGDNKIGLGHIYRSINLCQELKYNNFQVVFLTKHSVARKILKANTTAKIFCLKNINDRKKLIVQLNPDIIVIDKLKENNNFLKFLQTNSKIIIGMDYIGYNRNLLNFNLGILYPYSTKSKKTISDLKYTIIDKKFSRKKNTRIRKKVKSVFVIQGGADTHCFIPKIISALNDVEEDFEITVVIGRAFKCWKDLKKTLNNNHKKIKLLKDVQNMSLIMSKQDIAITAGGNSLLELACLGIPSIIICAEEFEIETAKFVQKNGFGINLGFEDNLDKRKIVKTIKVLMANYYLRSKMNKMGRKIVDGKGLERVVSLIRDMN